jgi:hypothetical protein
VARQSVPSIPDPLQLITVGGYLMEATALIASPGPKRGRTLVTWRHAVVLLAAAAAFQTSALWYGPANLPPWLRWHPAAWGYLVASAALLAVAAGDKSAPI